MTYSGCWKATEDIWWRLCRVRCIKANIELFTRDLWLAGCSLIASQPSLPPLVAPGVFQVDTKAADALLAVATRAERSNCFQRIIHWSWFIRTAQCRYNNLGWSSGAPGPLYWPAPSEGDPAINGELWDQLLTSPLHPNHINFYLNTKYRPSFLLTVNNIIFTGGVNDKRKWGHLIENIEHQIKYWVHTTWPWVNRVN